ncbi:hypothetical protein KIN20_013868 [Parelaphostrongylus tenuis]|uniref:Uncharacterized protein n=1 Tax=Parelaphostrongylus tenuis TaxID=148309 RepID=A0AAD5MCQ8_PARTN|nr:hypothetical protein KIN20_013860 [Parelaphostrongylus tenuis]KAJ1356197.1 hypothetical protein KIN20_013865 [Parelaphostrongylus tenuis]KAJ1356199.1 hypothetical protein KIN20_013868 [Parelaphostrongylus tenuis]
MLEEMRGKPIKTSLWEWVGGGLAGRRSTNVFNGNTELRSFANMIKANMTAVGCYSLICADRASSSCVFSHPYAT